MSRLPIDELNILEQALTEIMSSEGGALKPEETVDAVLDILIMSYMYGIEDGNSALGTDIKADIGKMSDVIYLKVADKSFSDRVREYANNGDVKAIVKVADTESTRIHNEGVQYVGVESGQKVNKRWSTMLDDRVRDTHFYLEGEEVGINEKFFTYDGDSALYPGGFNNAENNISCRCIIELVKAEKSV